MIARILKDKKLIASAVIVILLIFILYASIPFISAFFGALILAFIFRPLNRWLKKELNFSPALSAWIILIISLILIILPTFFIINGIINQVSLLPEQLAKIKGLSERINQILPVEIELNTTQLIQQIMPILRDSIRPIFTNIINAFFVLFLLFFLLYYFVVNDEKIRGIVYDLIPFNEEHKKRIVEKFKEITYSTILGTFFIAVIQGGLLGLNFYLLGIPNALFWGFVTAILSFLPIVGAPLVWVPAAIIFILIGGVGQGVALIIIGLLIGTIDNILRPIINERYGRIHPLISIIGIYIGITQFGVIGIFIGPLLVAYLILFWELYKEEHMSSSRRAPSL